jgi:prevent-host-death family protein
MTASNSMPITKARINLGAVIERVMRGERITLEKSGMPVATIIGQQDLEDLQDALSLAQLKNKHMGERGTPLEDVLKKHGV